MDDKHSVDFKLYYGNVENDEMIASSRKLTSSIGHIDFVTDVEGSFLYCLKQIASTGISVPTVSIYIFI